MGAKKARSDDDKGLQKAFDTEFSCKEVVTADSTQCKEKDDQGRSVRSFCQLSCHKARKQAEPSSSASASSASVIRDGDYSDYVVSSNRCAAVGSEQSSCQSTDSRGAGCACQTSSQCGAVQVQGSKCCYRGFCSYKHLPPLDPCL